MVRVRQATSGQQHLNKLNQSGTVQMSYIPPSTSSYCESAIPASAVRHSTCAQSPPPLRRNNVHRQKFRCLSEY
ncbi:hypothetical protein B0G80_7348 [Paraburkholderia sp. BL6669N2]|nr:hypothetical protein B0G80_7348 [Paraburkholderia sp. BL6669N2]